MTGLFANRTRSHRGPGRQYLAARVASDRTKAMYRHYQAGETLAQVGARFGVTWQAVQRAFVRAGFKMRSPAEGKAVARPATFVPAPRPKRKMSRAEREAVFAELLAEGATPNDAAVSMGFVASYGRVMLASIRKQLGWQAV